MAWPKASAPPLLPRFFVCSLSQTTSPCLRFCVFPKLWWTTDDSNLHPQTSNLDLEPETQPSKKPRTSNLEPQTHNFQVSHFELATSKPQASPLDLCYSGNIQTPSFIHNLSLPLSLSLSRFRRNVKRQVSQTRWEGCRLGQSHTKGPTARHPYTLW